MKLLTELQTLNAMTNTERSFIIDNFDVETRNDSNGKSIEKFTVKGTCRPSAIQFATSTLLLRKMKVNEDNINTIVFNTYRRKLNAEWGRVFNCQDNPNTWDNKKGTKQRGGLKAEVRINTGLARINDIDENTFTCNNEKSEKIRKRRDRLFFKLARKEERSNVALSKCKKHVSNMLYLHLSVQGKLTY